jgi:hypothetical protein
MQCEAMRDEYHRAESETRIEACAPVSELRRAEAWTESEDGAEYSCAGCLPKESVL